MISILIKARYKFDSLLFITRNQSISNQEQMSQKLFIGVVGIYGAYVTMSVLTEKLFNLEYESTAQLNEDGSAQMDKFKFPLVLVWLGALFCSIFGFLRSYIQKEKANPIPLKEQAILGFLYTLNISTTNFALLYVSYPVQVIGRNCRFLFVVIIGAFFSRVKKSQTHLKLSPHKIYIASVITIGVLMFNFLKESKKDKADSHDASKQWIGYILLVVSILCDALFSDSQAYSKANFKPSANQLFTTANFFTFVFTFFYSIAIDGSIIPSMLFCMNHPRVVVDLLCIGVLQVIGQVSIYYVVANFKQHVFPLISTTRKIVTVLLSIFIFGHTINHWQWISIFIVFFGMSYELYEQIQHANQRKIDEKLKQHSLQIKGNDDEDEFDIRPESQIKNKKTKRRNH